MKKEELKEVFEHWTAIDVGECILYDNLELEDPRTGVTRSYKDIDEVFADKDLAERLEKMEVVRLRHSLNGGRGASSGSRQGFGSAGRGQAGEGSGRPLFPAEFNNQGRFVSQDETIKRFMDKYKDSPIEYAISVDNQGFVHHAASGRTTSVELPTIGKGHMIVHNHPSGGNFSSVDLKTTALLKQAKGIVATTPTGAHRFTKGNNFNARGFEKALRNASWPKSMGYDKRAAHWLKSNAKKFGYTYEFY